MRFHVVQCVLLAAACGLPSCSGVGAPGQSREASAISSLRTIVSGEVTYASVCANFGYAQSLEDLNRPRSGTSDPFIGADLATSGVVKNGYVITLRAGDGSTVQTAAADTCNGSTQDAMTTFFAEAHPDPSSGISGRSFATDQRGDIYARADGKVIGPDMSGATVLE